MARRSLRGGQWFYGGMMLALAALSAAGGSWPVAFFDAALGAGALVLAWTRALDPPPPRPPLVLSGALYLPDAAARFRESLRGIDPNVAAVWDQCPACSCGHRVTDECVEPATDAELLAPARGR